MTDSTPLGEGDRPVDAAELARLEAIEAAAAKFITAHRGWEPWGKDGFLHDTSGGFQDGSVYSTEDALEHFTEAVQRRRTKR